MNKSQILKGIVSLFLVIGSHAILGQRISVSDTEFRANGGRIWLNGTNTPWNSWNDFGGSFDYDWWNDEFEEQRSPHQLHPRLDHL